MPLKLKKKLKKKDYNLKIEEKNLQRRRSTACHHDHVASIAARIKQTV
jgi:hypothetical protein